MRTTVDYIGILMLLVELHEGFHMTEQPDASEPRSPFEGLAAKIRPQGSVSKQDAAQRDPIVVVYRARQRRRSALGRVFSLISPPATVYLDGQEVAELDYGERCVIETSPGKHELVVDGGKALGFEINKGERRRYICHDAILGSILMRMD